MTVHNRQRFVRHAIESILDQTYENFQFIIVDDGSTDRSGRILDDFARRDPRIKVIHQPNRGIPKAANAGLAHCRGEYVARFDSDDVSFPHRLATQVEFLDREKAVCVGSAAELIDVKGRVLTTIHPPSEDGDIQRLQLVGHVSLLQPSVMMRREAVQQVGGYDEMFPAAEDLDLWLRLGEIGSLANLPQPLIQYRMHAGGISETRRADQQRLMKLACQRAWRRRGITGEFHATESWRAMPGRHSHHAFMLRYGWWAFNSGHRRTAAIYGCKAISQWPFDREGWQLLACAIIKSPPQAPAPSPDVTGTDQTASQPRASGVS